MNAYRVKVWCGDWGGGVFASCCRGSNCSLTRAMDGRINAAAHTCIGSCGSTATSDNIESAAGQVSL